jgi:uncharacterized protein
MHLTDRVASRLVAQGDRLKKIWLLTKKIINVANQRESIVMDKDLQPDDWILPFLFIGSEPNKLAVKGSLLLFKEFFVFVKEIKPELDSYFKFFPYDYGPYSFELKTKLGVLQLLKFIKIERVKERTDYYLTEKGVEKAQELSNKIDQKTKEKITKLRNDGTRLGYLGVLNYVYARYPEYTTASKIREDIRCH